MPSETDVASLNRHHFDGYAALYDKKPWVENFNVWLKDQIEKRKIWIGLNSTETDDGEENDFQNESESKPFRVLDYAAGTGVVSQALAPHVSQVLAVDISQAMVNLYNKKVYNQGIPPNEMRAIRGDLISEKMLLETPEEDLKNWEDFDLVAVGLGFHHFQNVDRAAKQLVDRLREGGTLLIIDFKEHEPVHDESSLSSPHSLRHEHGHGHRHDEHAVSSYSHDDAHLTVPHHGFSEEGIQNVLRTAGLVEIEVIDLAAGFSWAKNSHAEDAGEFSTDKAGGEESEGAGQSAKYGHKVRRMVFMAKGRKINESQG